MQEDKEKSPDNITPIDRKLTPEEEEDLEKSIRRHPSSSGRPTKKEDVPTNSINTEETD